MRALFLLWTYVLGPWFFAEAEEPDVDPKKQKKMERKMKRAGMMQWRPIPYWHSQRIVLRKTVCEIKHEVKVQ